MKKNILFIISIFYMCLHIQSAHAAWYEVTGSAAIVSSEDVARLHALEDALYKAVNFAGADIGSISNLMPLLESDRREYLFSNHEVRYILVADRKIINKVMYVRTRIDIYPSATACHVEQYKKTMLIGNIDLASPQQAVMGQIYQLGDDFAQVLNRRLEQESPSFVPVGTTQYDIDPKAPERIKMIAQDAGAQYIIGGVITDLTATIEQKTLKEDIINRQFAMEINV
ncbi:MAG: flagellar assembly protein T N-terminal domain-containing protein, partial [Vibrio sp.]